MTDKRTVEDRIVESGVIAVLRGVSEDQIVPVSRALADAGVGALEITADGTRSAEMIADVDRELADTDAVIGAGTVLDAATAQSVIDAGATFVVSPHTSPDVVRTCNRHGVLAAPGVMTPTEAVTAMEAGADLLKMFPASTVGPGHIGALSGPLGDVDIIPTGGVSPDNVADFFDAGAVAVGAGGAILDDEAIERGDMEKVRETAEAFVAAVEDAR
ncbi:2-dehydro-3-deoxy-phosphogluconate aldolase, bacterial-type [Natrialba magadii ATCC 43099]|uniref:2-dehydro-3-deoxy-phosphogluconate aldolase, bacterial-type n=1 Tax=Natrialba magadii (strain ATCC 43099 / DSM 3394 / CCM 3739 / CIP 104546 / IAM 13178 / JCM 8861 / NBRC 102185 / NCIMB 2190 / MS3) TaxID=547559 RepID=D3SRM6_NATMM|nr:bifunctional 4-hydroxy-2-oxoglutarate aldolase/2-dehydro-3-deoxy-phosphogluconate aldolase [Natrialba magadii]ADD04731.1 2-dehydro-3-deoxy-phosphogluconate aldolase, bacterial-type [Natrialba magadii ATCC 43099]ELY24898.1 2-dehydro-3-deoxyphosphogluconate aldolase [Natrialba magadii ATCC 43099]